MKNFLFAFAMTLLASCSSNNNKTSTTDSMNRINDNSIGVDTSTGPNADGYAPPNAKMDTSQARKDSINTRNQ
jgi:hypothetical protein